MSPLKGSKRRRRETLLADTIIGAKSALRLCFLLIAVIQTCILKIRPMAVAIFVVPGQGADFAVYDPQRYI